MPLPNPGMDFNPFDTLPASQLDDLVENIEALESGSAPITAMSHATTALANPYKFRAYRNAAYSGVSVTITKMPYDTENFDSNNNFSTVNADYTAPVSGFYQFNARYATTGTVSNINYLVLYKNGSEISRGVNLFYAPNPMGLLLSDMIQLTAGDVVDVRYSVNGTPTMEVGTSTNFFGGYLISRT